MPTPDRRKDRSRPPSFAGRESPIQLRSRSSTSDSLRSGSSPNSGGGGKSGKNTYFNAPSQSGNSSGTVNTAAVLMASSGNSLSVLTNSGKPRSASGNNGSSGVSSAANAAGSLKKRAAPLPPPPSTTAPPHKNTHGRNNSDFGVSLPTQRLVKPSSSESRQNESRKSMGGDFVLNDSGRNHESGSPKIRTFHHSAAQLRTFLLKTNH